MKILYYVHALYVGGAETLVCNYLISLKDLGNEVVLVVNQNVDSFLTKVLRDNGIKIITLLNEEQSFLKASIERGINRILGYSKKWKRIYKEEKPDVVHIHTFCDAFESCEIQPEKLFFSFHSDVERSLSIGTKKNYRKLYEYAQKGMTFTALSQAMAVDIKEKMKTNKVVLVPNAIDLKKLRMNRYSRDTFLKEYNLPTDAFIVGHVGRFHPVKNHEKLFSVFSEVYHRNPAARLVLIGTGSQNEIEHIDMLKKKYHIEKVVLSLGLRSDATSIMSVFDRFVLTSISESFSLVLVEAQAQGVRCITSNVVPREVICDNCVPLDVNESDKVWAEKILSMENIYSDNKIEEFDISNVTNKLIYLYKTSVD